MVLLHHCVILCTSSLPISSSVFISKPMSQFSVLMYLIRNLGVQCSIKNSAPQGCKTCVEKNSSRTELRIFPIKVYIYEPV